MTNRNNDDLAAALAGIQGGDHAEPEHHDEAHQEYAAEPQSAPPPAPAPAPRAAAPQPAARPPAPRAPAPAARPTAPVPQARPRPAAPGQSAAPAPAARPAAPAARPSTARPAAPAAAARPAAPARPAGPVRAASPGALPAAPEEETVSNTQPVDADDAVIVPAAPVEYLGHTHAHSNSPYVRPQSVPFFKTLDFKQMMIPVRLVGGVCFMILGATKWICGDDTGLGNMSVAMAGAMIGVGLLMLGYGAFTMLQVQKLLTEKQQAQLAAQQPAPATGY